jgi:hypothetical protein
MGRFKYTEEQILESIRRFHTENGRIPKSGEFECKNGYPSRATVEKYFGSWNNAIEEAGFHVNRMNITNLTDKELLEHLERFEEEYGRFPTYKDLHNLKDNPGYPNSECYVARFGCLENAKKLIDQDTDSKVRKGIVENNREKARLAEIFVLEHFVDEGAVDLSGMDFRNPVDGICPNKLIYDVKSSSFRDGYYWQFVLDKENMINFYYLLAFNGDYSELKHVWRIPWNFIVGNHLQINIDKMTYMKKYEITEKFKDVFNKWKEQLK